MTTTRSGPERHAGTDATGQYAVLTPPGRGAVAVIRVRSANRFPAPPGHPLFRSIAGRSIDQYPVQRIVYGLWGKEPPEDVVLVRIDSSTTDIHCHGGQAAVLRITEELERSGCVSDKPWDSVLPDRSPLERELLATLTQASTIRTASWLRRQSDGRLVAAIQQLERLVQEQDKSADWRSILQERTRELLAWSDFGLHLTCPRRIVVAGRPNVGKSSLVNALVGFDRSVVFDQPGTTRDLLSVQTVLDGWPVEFIDTAGLRQTQETIEQTGIERAAELLRESANIMLVLDSSTQLTAEDEALLAQFPNALGVRSKADLRPAWPVERLPTACSVSAVTGFGLTELQTALVARLVPRLPPDDAAFPVTPRQVQLLEQLQAAVDDHEAARVLELLQRLLEGWNGQTG